MNFIAQQIKKKYLKNEKKQMILFVITLTWMKIVNANINYLVLLILLNIFCLDTLKNWRVIFIEEKQSKIIKKKLFFSCVYIKF